MIPSHRNPMTTTTPIPATAGPLRDFRAAVTDLRAEADRFDAAVERLTQDDAAAWNERAVDMALHAVAYATRSTLAVSRHREDAPTIRAANLERMRDADEALARRVAALQQAQAAPAAVALASAAHAAVSVAMCDEGLAAAVQQRIDQGLDAATRRDTASLASTLGRLSGTAPLYRPQPPVRGYPMTMPGGVQTALVGLNQDFVKDLHALTTRPAGDWRRRTYEIAARAHAHAARQALVVAGQHQDGVADREQAAGRIRKTSTHFTLTADGAVQGPMDPHDARRKGADLALEAVRHAREAVAQADAPVAKAVAPSLESLIALAQQTAPTNRTDLVWTAENLRLAVDDLNAVAQGEAAVQSTLDRTQKATPERRAVEVDFARADALRNEWEKALSTRGTRLQGCNSELHSIVNRVQTLADRAGHVLPAWQRGAIGLVVGGVAGLIGGVSLGFSGALGMGLTIAGTAVAATGFVVHTWAQWQFAKVKSEHKVLVARYGEVQSDVDTLEKAMNEVRTRRNDAERVANALEGQLEVFRMAEAINTSPTGPESRVAVEDGSIAIGGLKVPRRT